MKLIGIIGGMSWESTAEYYRLLNQLTARRLGGLHSARILLHSVDFQAVELAQREKRWDDVGRMLAGVGRELARAGADFLLLATNTMHKVAERITAEAAIPLLHIAEATGQAARQAGLHTVGLLGTRFTMEEDFYRGYLQDRFRIQVRIPSPADREFVDRVIYNELCVGRLKEASRREFVRIGGRLGLDGCEGIILGCTEIPLLLRPQDLELPLLNTAEIHARAAVDLALAEE